MEIISNNETIGLIVGIVSLGLTLIFGILGEHKLNLYDRASKKFMRFRNKDAGISLFIRYVPNQDFSIIKENIKSIFIEKYSNYRLLRENQYKLIIFIDIFTVEISHSKDNDIAIEVLKSDCGIQDLNAKTTKFLAALSDLNKHNNLFTTILSCNLSLYVPYKWVYSKVYEPSGFSLTDYSIKMKAEDDYISDVDIHLDSINASLSSTEGISSLLGKLL